MPPAPLSVNVGRDLVLVADVAARPNVELVVGAVQAGGLGVLDLPAPRDGATNGVAAGAAAGPHRAAGRVDLSAARAALDEVVGRTDGAFAVRLPHAALGDGPQHLRGRSDVATLPVELDLPPQITTVVLTGPFTDATATSLRRAVDGWPGRRVLVEVVSRAEALAARDAGVAGLVAKGCESGGRVGDTESFVLAQQVAELGLPFWVQGGVGLRSAPAVIAGGARGVLLDGQLALVRESLLDDEARRAVRAVDGTETRVIGGHRLYVRPDLPAAALPADTEPGAVAAQLGPDLHRQLLPLGQDAATAAELASRHVTAGGVVRAVRRAVDEHLAAAAQHRPLAPGAGVSRTHGTRYPVVQGPMTRVSDRAELAAAVADAGGLPFLALSLLPGPDVRRLLNHTATLLGDRPWGVGVLGFVPPDVRAAQLEVVHDVRPPVALIAGGHPAQARPLEDAGITTYLHVPSPGLLDRFLREGARRFVFEGRECGGHVGPRASLPLWEAQVERLLAVDQPAQLDVLFAGGIHDARSAAMVAALAAPLVGRGARVGVLMGTAYLFTHEVVGTGAVTPAFQATARDCDATVLLETAPGHATRCAATDYVQTFATRKAELEATGCPPQDLWAELESLNLGRLRVASKGVGRQGDRLIEVDETTQRREGLYMIGQVATLRRELTTVAELHEQVSAGATAHLEGRLAELGTRLTGEARPLDVAIVGMAAVFPGAADTERYWANVLAGVDAVTEVPRSRWDPDTFYDPEATTTGAGRRTPSRWGGFLPPVPFDPLAHGIPPRSLAAIEPVQLLGLEVAQRALADAGYADGGFDRSRAAVVFATESGNDLGSAYGFRAGYPHFVGPLPPSLDDHLPALTEDSFPGVLANVLAGRIANRLDLGGPNLTVDAACASSLAALDVACKELTSGDSDVVLCGAADVHNGITDYLLFASAHALSPTGRCRPFDAGADGIALGEGVACLVLKRLADARRDGDRVYAVVEGVGSSSDGRHQALTAPRQEGQARALARAYERSGSRPASVGLVEAHGTGTVVGDRTELGALTEAFTADGAAPGAAVLGSVKSQIGHTKCAAGLAGLVKAARAVHAGVLPPTIHLEAPNDGYDAASSPFRFLQRPAPWPAATRRAAVSAFGFGGTNFHAVLRNADADAADNGVGPSHPDRGEGSARSGSRGGAGDPSGDPSGDPDGDRHPGEGDGAGRPRHGLHVWPAELLLVRAESDEAAEARLAELRRTVARVLADDPAGERHRLRDLAWAVSSTATDQPVRWALVADDLADLDAKLAAAMAGTPTGGVLRAADVAAGLTAEPGAGGPVVAFLHPGQGSQRPGMLADLLVAFPWLQAGLALGERWLDRLFPAAAFTPEERAAQRAALTDTRAAQPALALGAVAVTRLLRSLGVEPAMAAGHSSGELAALWTAGMLDEATLVDLSAGRGEATHAALTARGDDPGAMAAVHLPVDQLRPRLPEGVVVANHNAPTQTVVAGPTDAVDALVARLGAERIGARRLDVAGAFHSPLVADAALDLAARLSDLETRPPRLPVWSNSTATPYPAEPEYVRALLAEQLARPVRFVDQVEAMYAAGARVFVEAGPGRVLTDLVRRILGDRPHRAVACDVAGEPGLRRFLLALAELAAAGTPVDVRPLFEGRAERVELEALPSTAPGWRVNGHLVCTPDGEPVPGGLQPADRVPEVAMHHGGRDEAPDRATDLTEVADVTDVTAREQALLAYLRTMQQVVAAQRDVMLRYLTAPDGAEPGEAVPVLGTPEPLAPASEPTPTSTPVTPPPMPATTVQAATLPVTTEPATTEPATTEPATTMPATTVPAATEPAAATPATTSSNGHGLNGRAATNGHRPARLRGDELLAAALALVAERTGYPPDMLDPDLDLEADLSIDSIKRVEILGELTDRIGLPAAAGSGAGVGLDESAIEQLARRRTLREMARMIDELSDVVACPPAVRGPAHRQVVDQDGDEPGDQDTLAGDDDADLLQPDEPPAIPVAARRFVVETAMLPPALPVASAAGKSLALISDPWEGLDELRVRLERSGATVQVLPLHRGAPNVPLPEAVASLLARVDAVVHLGAADRRAPVDARDVFTMLRPAVDGAATTLVAAVAPLIRGTPARASGVPGLMRALARELPDRHVRAVELPADQPPDVVARLLADEILDPAGPASVAYREGTRLIRRVVKGTALGRETPALPFDARSVILVTGGARGITARVALALARVTGCRLELVGRSPVPQEDEDPRISRATDRRSLRQVLVELGGPGRTPEEIESACDRILAAREIRATLAAVRATGSPVTYHSADVRNRAALERVLQDVRTRHGRIDAIVHGAGVLDDRLAQDKRDPAFDRVFATKVDAAYTLLAQIQNDVRLVVFFGSVSGVFGNRGQVDYCAANDALDDLANRLDGFGGRRVISIDWGPWAATGMVSPELEREYARRGVGLLDPEEGARAVLAEMATLPGEAAQVVVMRAEPEAFLDRRESTPVALPAPTSRQAAGRGGRGGSGRPDPRHLTLEDLTERG